MADVMSSATSGVENASLNQQQDEAAGYNVIKTIYDASVNLLETSGTLETAAGVYDKVKSNLPEAQQQQMTNVEASLSENFPKVDDLISQGDSAIDGLVRKTKTVLTEQTEAVVELKESVSQRITTGLEDTSALVISVSDSSLSTMEGIVEKLLPAAVDGDEVSKGAEDEEAAAVNFEGLAVKAATLSKKATKRLQDRAMLGLDTLKLRTESVQSVDLIKYAKFLDAAVIMEHASAGVTEVSSFVQKNYKELDECYITPSALVVREKFTEALAKAGELSDIVNTKLVVPAKEYYTVAVATYLSDPRASVETFVAKLKEQIGPEWSKDLENATTSLYTTLDHQWNAIVETGTVGRGRVTLLVTQVGDALTVAWEELQRKVVATNDAEPVKAHAHVE